MVSIIIPCYNAERYIAETILSVKNQSYNDWECIIVNDGSTDNSEKIILDLITDDDRFAYVKQENSGPGKARNTGASFAKGKYITFLDADDMIGKDYLASAEEFLDRNENCILYYGKVKHLYEDTNKSFILKPTTRAYWEILFHNQFNATCVFRKKDFENIGGYNEDLDNKEDWEFYIRLLYRNRPFFIDDVLAFTYRHHKDSRNKEGSERIYFEKIMDLNPVIKDDFYNTVRKKY